MQLLLIKALFYIQQKCIAFVYVVSKHFVIVAVVLVECNVSSMVYVHYTRLTIVNQIENGFKLNQNYFW